MRRRITKYMMLYAIVHILSVSCSKIMVSEIDSQPESQLELNISGSISQVPTKATASGFVDGDVVGLYAVNYGASNAARGELQSSGNQVDNVSYVFNESGQTWKPDRKAYYKDAKTNVDMYVYYPYMTSIDDVRHFEFEVASNQGSDSPLGGMSPYEKSDLLWGSVLNVTPTDSKVPVTLRHRLSSVVVTLKEGSGFSEGEFASLPKDVVVRNVSRKAEFDFMTGQILRILSAQDQSIMMQSQNEEDTQFRAIVAPQSIESEVTMFSITLNGIPYSFSRQEATVYESGKQNVFTITVNSKGHGGEYEFELSDVEITEWHEDKLSHGGVARQYYAVNVEEPGTLGAVIKAAQKNPDKIRNLKVTGCLNSDDFYFMRDSLRSVQNLNLKDVTRIEEGSYSLSGIYYVNKENYIPGNAFYKKNRLENIILPDILEGIHEYAFSESGLLGKLIIPSNVKEIERYAFMNTGITFVDFPQGLETISSYAFYNTDLSGNLYLPESLELIGTSTFAGCHFSGPLHIPAALSFVGMYAFDGCRFSGDLVFDHDVDFHFWAFSRCSFTGRLDINGLKSLSRGCFECCGFSGPLVIPEGIEEIPENAFKDNKFSSVHFPEGLRDIGARAFMGCSNIMYDIDFPESLETIAISAFSMCRLIPSIMIHENCFLIEEGAFRDCFGVSKITCLSEFPPIVESDAFAGVAKDNFDLEVPKQSVTAYKMASGWNDFKRITPYYGFSINRREYKLLNKGETRPYLLRAPSGYRWEVGELPDWISVTPSSGVGKTEVMIGVDDMLYAEGNALPRTADIVFKLCDVDKESVMTVTQYNYEHSDGDIISFRKHTKGKGVRILISGDGYDAEDIAAGTYMQHIENAVNHFFSVEPYKSYSDYFDIDFVCSLSYESGISDVNTVIDTKYGINTGSGLPKESFSVCLYELECRYGTFDDSLMIILLNTADFFGQSIWVRDSSDEEDLYRYFNTSISLCSVTDNPYPFDFRGIVQKYAGGVGFAHLGEEYPSELRNFSTCPAHFEEWIKYRKLSERYGWYKNVSDSGDIHNVPWSHMIFNPTYSDYVDLYEGAMGHMLGAYRSESSSCMLNYVPYYNSISRQAIVEEIKRRAGEPFSLEEFYANDSFAYGN